MKTDIELTERDEKILAHVERYRMTTRDVLHPLFFPNSRENAVSKVLSRLIRTEMLNAYPLWGKGKYYSLGKRGVTHVGCDSRRANPLGCQALPHEYGTLLFCHCGERERARLRPTLLEERYPWLPEKARSGTVCLENESNRLCLIRTDYGGSAAHVCRRAIKNLGELGEAAHRLCLVVLTPSAGKATAILEAAEDRVWPCEIQVAVLPQLVPLVCGLRK